MTIKNNLFVTPAASGYAFIYAPSIGSLYIENNTFVNATYGVYVGAFMASTTSRENIFYDVSDAVYSPGTIYSTSNAYKPNPEPYDPTKIVLTSSPFSACALLGDYFLSPSSACRNYVNARTAQQAGLSDQVFTVASPAEWTAWYQANQTLSSLTVSRHALYPNPTTDKVCLGYHAPRIDALIGNLAGTDATIEVTGTLTLAENSVLAIAKGGELQPRADFSCLGDPWNMGWNYVIAAKGASTVAGLTLRSPKKGDGENAQGIVVFQVPVNYQVRFTRFLFLEGGISSLSSALFTFRAENCSFEWCSVGMYSAFFSELWAKNCLFRDCHLGMSNQVAGGAITAELCTFDRNEFGIQTSSTANVTDCLFTGNRSGEETFGQSIGILKQNGTLREKNCAYFKLNLSIGGIGQQLDPTSYSLPDSNNPYNRTSPDKNESVWYLRGVFNNPLDPTPPSTEISLEDAGSKPTTEYTLLGTLSVSSHAIKDVGMVDVGYHWPVLDGNDTFMPQEWKSYFGVTNPDIDEDGDLVTNLDEYRSGINPHDLDTDHDSFLSGREGNESVEGTDAPSSNGGEQPELGFVNGPARADLRRSPYIQIASIDTNEIVFFVYWGFDEDWWPLQGPQRDTFFVRGSSQPVFTEIPFEDIEDCNNGFSNCYNGQDFELILRRVRLSTIDTNLHLERGSRCFYKVRYVEDPANPSGRVVETPVYSFPIPEASPSSFSFLVYGDTEGPFDLIEDAGFYNPIHAALIDTIVSDLRSEQNNEVRNKLLFGIHTGDFVVKASQASQWSEHYFYPAARLLRSLPIFPVAGEGRVFSRPSS